MTDERVPTMRPPVFRGVPANEIPVPVPMSVVLARGDDIAVWMSGVVVFRSCVTFSVDIRVTSTPRLVGMYGFGRPESGHTPAMPFGVEDYAGTVSTNLPGRRTGLNANGSRGGRLRGRMDFVLAPVPPPGPMTIRFAWPQFGVEEVAHTVDGDLLASAVSQVEVLWDDIDESAQPPIDLDDRSVPELEVPRGGWFDAALRLQTPSPGDPDALRRRNFAF